MIKAKEMSEITSHHGSLLTGNDRRLKQRRRAETRLKTYGIAAIGAAGLALVALLSSVMVQASKAVTETYVTLPVTLDTVEIDPNGTGDPKTILRADFSGLTKATLRNQFPTIKGRSEKRALYDLVSSGAAFELAQKVSEDTSLVGQTIDYDFLASDVTDLYLKGVFGEVRQLTPHGTLQVEPDGKTVQLTSSGNDFSVALAQVKKQLLIKAKTTRAKAALQNNGVEEFRRRAEMAETEKDHQKNLKLAAARAKKRDTLLDQAADLERRATGNEGAEELDDDTVSFLVKVGNSWIKLTRVDTQRAEGIAIGPLSAGTFANWGLMVTDLPENARKVSDTQIVAIEQLRDAGAIKQVFNWRFFTSRDSREPELAGIWGAAVGSFWTMLVTFSLAFPIGVMAAIYLEEFAPKNKFTDFIEININNLAAVPSIVFGLLGLSVFLGVFGVPRSAPLAGGIVLALMTLPTIIIAARAAIKAVPPSIRDAALGVGASRLQTTFHHVLPLAMPGILTGTIIGMAQALGETAPLIMIGMVAFIVDIPGGITESASVLPVQVFRWSDFPERAFEAKTGAAICVLLAFLVIMNAIAIFLRRRFERRW